MLKFLDFLQVLNTIFTNKTLSVRICLKTWVTLSIFKITFPGRKQFVILIEISLFLEVASMIGTLGNIEIYRGSITVFFYIEAWGAD